MTADYVIAGATGLVGSECVRLLSDAADMKNIFCVGRRPAPSDNARVQFVPWDFSGELTFKKNKPKQPIAICTLGTTIKIAGSQEAFRKVDFDFVLRFAEEMQALGAESLHVVTAHGANAHSMIFYNRVKGELENRLQGLNLAELHIYHPSLLLGERREQRAGEGFATATAKFLSPLFKLPGLNAVAPTPVDRLAAFILARCQVRAPGCHIHSNYEILHD